MHAFEASPKTFNLLKLNTDKINNIIIYLAAISDTNERISFFEFPAYYAEYNSLIKKQYESENWFEENKPVEVTLDAITIDDYCLKNNIVPKFIKIDIEGAEDKAILGAENILRNNNVQIAMEYLSPLRFNKPHQIATTFMKSIGYISNLITKDGQLEKIEAIDEYLINNKVDSENIVFIKQSLSS